MAAGDPEAERLLGSSDEPILYHTVESFFSQICRLCLEEKEVKWYSREVDIHGAREQLSPWYMRISPGACVPTLLHKGRAIPESLDINRYVDATFETGVSLTPADAAGKETMEAFLKHARDFDVEVMTFGYVADWNPIFAKVGPGIFRNVVKGLETVKAEHPDVSEVVDRKIAQNKDRVAKIFGPPNGFRGAHGSFCAAIDTLEAHLQATGGPYICGQQYTLADVEFTNILARGNWIKPGREAVAARPAVAAYWKLLQARPSFRSAGLVPSFQVPSMVKRKLLPRVGGFLCLVAVLVVAVAWLCA